MLNQFKNSILILLTVLLFSCEKEAKPVKIDDEKQDVAITAPSDILMAERLFLSIAKTTIKYAPPPGSASTLPPPPFPLSDIHHKQDSIDPEDCFRCPEVHYYHTQTNPYQHEMTIDYGSDGIVGEDSVLRKGVIKVISSGMFNMKGSTTTTIIENFYIDGYKVSGTKLQTNLGLNENYNLVFKDEIVDATITTPDGKTMRWSQTSESTWVNGGQTHELEDDEYLISGSRSGIDTKGRSYQVDIVKPLNILMSCKYIRGGQTKTTLQDAPYPILVDFGAGACDNDAFLEVNGKQISIKID